MALRGMRIGCWMICWPLGLSDAREPPCRHHVGHANRSATSSKGPLSFAQWSRASRSDNLACGMGSVSRSPGTHTSPTGQDHPPRGKPIVR
ncbi:hypothetical protein CGRA01v4_01824 [Colletotrichum graminicola]|nr:hypothetical protein CGRA01v4_01824 [Colletotrichum graminicola]